MTTGLRKAIGAGLLACALAGATAAAPVPRGGGGAGDAGRPNIVLLYADDLGYGDAGCYGATAIPTPNMDRLAREGLRFTDGHATAATCTPSRFSLLTGSHAFRQPGVSILKGDAGLLIRPGVTTLPGMLGRAGYRTGIVGKWHLGLGDGSIDWNGEIKPSPLETGFGYQFILPATLDRVPCVFIEGRRVVNLDPADPITVSYEHPVGSGPTGFSRPDLLRVKADPQHSGTIINGVSRIGYMAGGKHARWNDEEMADVLAGKATDFIRASRGQPFFLYYALPEPHVPRIPHPRFAGKTSLGPRGDVIVQLDWQVGRILDALDEAGLAGNTLVILSSDNGPVLNDGYQDGSVRLAGAHRPAGPLAGGKYSGLEGGTRVPFIVRWPGRVAAGTTSGALISQVDLLASLATLAGQPLAGGDAPDSIDLLPVLLGKAEQGRTELLEEACRGFGYRLGDWKIDQEIQEGTGAPGGRLGRARLYNLAADLGETHDLAAREPERLAQVQAALRAMLDGRGSRR